MPLPLIAMAVASGGVKGALSALTTRGQSRRNKLNIKDAFRRGDSQLRLRQGDIREATNENLAERGLLNAGGQAPAPQLEALRTGAKGVGLAKQAKYNAGVTGRNERRTQSAANEVGIAGTIASGVSSDLSKEFYKERDDLYSEEQNALKSNKASTIAGYVGAAAGGIQTAFQAAAAFGPGAKVSPPAAAMPSGIPGQYGIDVVDPLKSLEGPNFSLTLPTQKGPT